MSIGKELREWLDVLIKSVIILCCLYVFLWPFKIDGNSMEKTFSNNDRIAISRLMSFLNFIDYGDCVVCKIDTRGETERIIKRVIGKPGDVIKIEAGQVFRNGELLDEPYISDARTNGSVELTLGEDEYFLMGDNRGVSYDSRAIGPISKSQILGKVIVKWYPFGDIKIY